MEDNTIEISNAELNMNNKTIIGNNNRIVGNYCIIIGNNNNIIGNNNIMYGLGNVQCGNNNTIDSLDQIVIPKRNSYKPYEKKSHPKEPVVESTAESHRCNLPGCHIIVENKNNNNGIVQMQIIYSCGAIYSTHYKL